MKITSIQVGDHKGFPQKRLFIYLLGLTNMVRVWDNTVMKLNDNIVLARAKKENEINVLAKYLRRSIENINDLKLAVNELFKGDAEVSLDNDDQVIIYTGHAVMRHMDIPDIYSVSRDEFLNADQ